MIKGKYYVINLLVADPEEEKFIVTHTIHEELGPAEKEYVTNKYRAGGKFVACALKQVGEGGAIVNHFHWVHLDYLWMNDSFERDIKLIVGKGDE